MRLNKPTGRKRTMTKTMLAALAILFACSALHAQDVQPTCKNCPGTYIPSEEIQAYAKRAVATKVIDQQVRAVDIGKSNVDIGLVYRGKLTTPAPDAVAEHDQVSEVYHVIDGSATLMTGPDILGKK